MEWLKKNLWVVVMGAVLTVALLAAVWQAGREYPEPEVAPAAAVSAEEAFSSMLRWHELKYPELSDYEIEARRTVPGDGCYEIRFTRGGYDFRYLVDSENGFVRAEETDYTAGALQPAFLQDLPPAELPQPEPKPEPAPAGDMHVALWTALEHAGLKEAEISDAEVQTEYDGDRPMCYKVLFRSGEVLYGYEIGLNGSTVLAWEKVTNRAAGSETGEAPPGEAAVQEE